MTSAKIIEQQAMQEFEKSTKIPDVVTYRADVGLYMLGANIDKETQTRWMLFFRAWIKSRNIALTENLVEKP